MGESHEKTVMFQVEPEKEYQAREILHLVYNALVEKGYSPINQIVGTCFQVTRLTLLATKTPAVWCAN